MGDNTDIWAAIMKLADEHGYEFDRSWESVSAFKRIATRIAKDTRYGAQLGTGSVGKTAFSFCFVLSLLDNAKCGVSAGCHTFAAVEDGIDCAVRGAIGGGISGGIGGAVVGAVRGIITAYEEY